MRVVVSADTVDLLIMHICHNAWDFGETILVCRDLASIMHKVILSDRGNRGIFMLPLHF